MKKNDMKIILNDKTLLNPEQIDIYNGLKSIGNEIASFYLDGVKIYEKRGSGLAMTHLFNNKQS